MISFLGYSPEDFLLLPKGANGYKKLHRLSSFPISILSDGNEDMGIHVVISGSAVPDLLVHFRASITSDTPFAKDVICLSDLGANFFTVGDMRGFPERQEVVSKFRTYRDVYESTFTNENTGHTIYFGSRQSEVMLRVYDKQLEQNQKAADPDDMIDDPLVRWELELKNDRANIAADFLIKRKQIGEVIMEVLNNYVRLIIQDDSNRSRCSSHPLWEKFVGMVGKLRLYVEAAQKTIEDKKRWLIRQCLPTIAGVIIADGGSFDIITQHFDDAVSRMNNSLRYLVAAKNPDWMQDYDALLA